MSRDEIIPLTECIKGHAYNIQSRNLIVGVFNGDTGFVGVREKLGSEYLFTEYHYDIGAPFGTVNPFADLGECPIEDLAESHHFEWKGDGTDPSWAMNGYPYRITNQPLFDWLKAKERAIAVPCVGCGQPFWPTPWGDGFCFRTACWDARCKPCPTCGTKVLDSDGTQICDRCTDPLAYDLRLIEAMNKLDAERAERTAQYVSNRTLPPPEVISRLP